VASTSQAYSPDWVSDTGLNLDPGFCITLVADIDPGEALHRLGVGEEAIRTAGWPELVEQARALTPAYEYAPLAVFTIGEFTVVVEENGCRGTLGEWNQALSQGTEVVNVYSSPSSGNRNLTIVRDSELRAYIDGDSPEDIDADGEILVRRLSKLMRAALKPLRGAEEAPERFSDGWVDLLQVACDYAGLRPTVYDISGPALGAPVKL
jgi:hypothetical protein